MKVRMLKNVLVEVQKTRLDEVWDIQLSRWQELALEKIELNGPFAFLTTFDGDVYLNVPVNSYQILS